MLKTKNVKDYKWSSVCSLMCAKIKSYSNTKKKMKYIPISILVNIVVLTIAATMIKHANTPWQSTNEDNGGEKQENI